MAAVLNAFDKPPLQNVVTVLLLGSQGIGKQAFAQSLIDTETPFSMQIRTASTFPLPADTEESRPNIDFICFMMDLRYKNSMKFIESCLQQVDVEYFLGRSCLVAMQGDNPLINIVEEESVEDLATEYNLPTLFIHSENKTELSHHANRIIQLCLISSGFKRHVTPAVIDTTKDFDISPLV